MLRSILSMYLQYSALSSVKTAAREEISNAGNDSMFPKQLLLFRKTG